MVLVAQTAIRFLTLLCCVSVSSSSEGEESAGESVALYAGVPVTGLLLLVILVVVVVLLRRQIAANDLIRMLIHANLCSFIFIGPIPWGHSGPLCHALSLSSALSWPSMHRRRATVPLATSGEWA